MEVRLTPEFARWLSRLRDRRARVRIALRIRRAQSGNLGDHKPVGGGLSEMRVNHGPGYRLYFVRRGNEVVILLHGGDKSSQRRDIAEARRLAEEW